MKLLVSISSALEAEECPAWAQASPPLGAAELETGDPDRDWEPRRLPLTAEASAEAEAEAGAAAADRVRAGVCTRRCTRRDPGSRCRSGPKVSAARDGFGCRRARGPRHGSGPRSGETGGEVEGLDVLAGCLGSDL